GLVRVIDLVAVTVALGNLDGAAIDFRDPTAALERRGVSPQPHGAAEIAALGTLLEFVAAQPFRHQAHQGLARRAELGGVRLLDADEIARGLDHGHLHAEADAEIRHVALSRELRRADLALGAALAESAGHQDAVDVLEEWRWILVLEYLALDPVEIDLHLVGDAAMRERLDQRLIRILHAGIFADDGDGNVAL